MYITDEDIESIRGSIASIVYNDCLPTSLVTNNLKEICNQYDIFQSALSEDKRNDAMKAMHMNIDLINRQHTATGASGNIFYTRNEPDAPLRIAKSIATIYAVPYKADLEIDYVGYAYGTVAQKIKNNSMYGTYRPDAYMNQCNRTILENGNKSDARNMHQLTMSTINAFKSFIAIRSGEIHGNAEDASELIKSRLAVMDQFIESMGGKPEPIQSKLQARTIAACMSSDYEFAKKTAVEEMRDYRLFKDTSRLLDSIEF